MLAENQNLEEILFDLAVQKPTAEERAEFLNHACRDNPGLRAQVEELLAIHFGAKGFLPGPAAGQAAPLTAGRPAPAETPAPMIGRYKLLERIGEGGFGEVWMAEQREPVKRRVALKIIKLGMDTRQVVARFEAERQALALMEHPNIAKVFDAGATDTGRPYFVMELVRGAKITEYCDKNVLPAEERLKLFILVCQAIQHAHQKGIIHRDIKPSNILVTLHDGVPVPKVIDFGIAKATQGELTDKTLFTQFQQFIGTPAYISPEQAEPSGLDIDTRSDIYSLGVLLYELLVGQTPFDAKEMTKGGIDALRRIIQEKEPLKPSTKLKTLPAAELTTTAERRQTDALRLTRLLRGDLDWIVMKCLEKDRARRYETANGLAMDIQRYLANEPVVARPPSTAYKIQKLVRRNKFAFAATALILLALILGAIAVIFVQRQANQDYRRRLYVSEVNRAGLAWQSGQSTEMRLLLENCPAPLRHWEWNFLHQQLDRWESKVFLTVTNLGEVDLSADGRLLAAQDGATIHIYEYPGGQWLRSVPFDTEAGSKFAFSPTGDFIATLHALKGAVSVWNVRTGERVLQLSHGSVARALAWSNNGKLMATGGDDRTIRLWNTESGRAERHFTAQAPITGLALAPDDRAIAVGTSGTDLQLLDTATGAIQRTLRSRGPVINRLKFSPDGRNLVSGNATAGGYRSDQRVWSLDDGGSLDLSSSAETIAYSFSGDSQRLVTGDGAGMIQIWDLERRAELERFTAHIGSAKWVRLLPDGQILSAGFEGAIKRWQARRESVVQLKGYPDSLRTLAFSPDNRWLAAAGLNPAVFLWDAQSGRLAQKYTNHARGGIGSVAFSREGGVASGGGDQMIHLWDPTTLHTKWETSLATFLAPAAEVWWLAFSPDGRRVYAPSNRDTLTVLDAATGQRVTSISGLENVLDGLAVSPDGQLIALGQKAFLSVRRAEDLHELWRAPGLPDRCVAFSPDGQWIATGNLDGTIDLWEAAAAGRGRLTLRGHAAPVKGVGFHPGGRRLVSGSYDGGIKIWDWRAGVELLTLPLPGGGSLWHVLFSPDGKTLAAAGGDGLVTLWKTE